MKSTFAILLLLLIQGLSHNPLKIKGTVMPISFVDIQHPVFQNSNINILSPLSIIISTEDVTSILQVKVIDKAATFKLYDKLFYCIERIASTIYFATLSSSLHDHSALTQKGCSQS
jgi:hypothetical protein